MEEQVLVELGKVSSTVGEIRDAQREMRQELLGTPDKDESQHGRLPRMERASEDHERRISVIEKDKILQRGYLLGAAGVGGACGAVMGFFVKLFIDLLKK